MESPDPPKPANRIDEIVFAKLKSLGIKPVLCSDAVFVRRAYLDVTGTLPTAEEAKAFIQRSGQEQTRRPDRPSARPARACRLLGHEMERYPANQGGVPRQALAQRGAGLSPLGVGIDRPEQAVRPVRPGTAHLQRQQFPRWAGQLLPRHPEQDSGGHRRGRGPGVDGHAGPVLAGRPSGRHGGLLLAGRLQAHQRVEGGDRLLGSPQLDRRARQHRAGNGRRGQVGDRHQPDSAGVGQTAERKRAAGGRLSGRHQDHDSAEPRSAGGVCRLADSAGESLVCESRRQPHLGVGDGTRHHPRAGRHPGRQPAQQPRTPGLPGEGAGLQRLRSEASEAADLHLDHVPVFSHTEVRTSRKRGPTSPATGCGEWRPRC